MRKFALAMASILMACASIPALAQMTDDQVVSYVKRGVAAGKTQDQIGQELLSRGVTVEQVRKIGSAYSSGSSSLQGTRSESSQTDQKSIQRTRSAKEMTEETAEYEVTKKEATAEDEKKNKIFGHDIFNLKTMTFEPNENAATPENYKLGPGDQIVIDIWGYNEASMQRTISPEGKIIISQVGPVQLSGLTIKEASEKIRKALISKYASLGGENPNTSVSVTLSQIRTIQVNVMDGVVAPGTYRLSSFATVFTAIYRAGGVQEIGSLRAIKVIRGGKIVAMVDLYGYLFEGKSDSDINLQDGDVIIVPPYVNLVNVKGSIKRPMSYELKEGESLGTLIGYAGGFASNAYTEDIKVTRQTGKEREIFTVSKKDIDAFKMADGDSVTVGATMERFSNMVEVKGYVFRPGKYELGGDIATVKQLISKAGGLKEDAFKARAVITREKDDLDTKTIAIDLGSILSGKNEDILLRKNDVLIVSGIHELEDMGTLTINGYVMEPGTFPYSENTTVEDLVLMAGGLLEGASMARVDVARRVKDAQGLQTTDTLGLSYTFAIKDGLAVTGDKPFYLEPYDVVSIRRSPTFQVQKYVTISGEVAFPGEYVLLSEGETISDLVKRAGGLNNHAYSQAARLQRVMDDNDRFVNKAIVKDAQKIVGSEGKKALAENDDDSIDTKSSRMDSLSTELLVNDTYNVAVNLEKALANPGSQYDVVLKDGDEIYVPEYVNTVRVIGEVMFPTAITYSKTKNVRAFVNSAGGFTENAKRSKTYVVYADGSAHKKGIGTSSIKPGCVIVVPAKKERTPLSTGEVLSLGSTTASMAAVIVSLINAL